MYLSELLQVCKNGDKLMNLASKNWVYICGNGFRNCETREVYTMSITDIGSNDWVSEAFFMQITKDNLEEAFSCLILRASEDGDLFIDENSKKNFLRHLEKCAFKNKGFN